MKEIKPRIPEGGAIKDDSEMTMEKYSETMKKKLGRHYDLFAENIIKTVKPDQNSKVLEIGSGPGWGGISLLKNRKDLILEGLEPSSDMIRVSTANAKSKGLENRINYIEGIGENMKAVYDGQYDLVISRESLHHWIEPEKVFLEIKRVLKTNGKVYICDHRRDISFFGKLIVLIFGTLLAGKMANHWKSSIAASYTAHEIKAMLAKTGCDDWFVNSDLMDLIISKN